MIVVTGASGFIGSNLVMELNRQGRRQIVAVDDYAWLREGTGFPIRSSNIRYGNCMSIAKYLDMHELPEWLEREGSAVRGIIHLGACSDTTVSDREWLIANNCEYPKALWHWCARTKRPFVYASSAATYGDGAHGYDDQRDPSRYRPLNFYGESKHLFDLWALRQSAAPPYWAGLKYFNVYGPNEGHKGRMASVIYHAYQQVQESGALRLFQSYLEGIPHGDQRRDFVYVKDVVAATLHLFGSGDRAANGLYNVGTGCGRTFNDLAAAVFRVLGREPHITYIPIPEDLRGRYQYFTKADITKLRNTGFQRPMASLEEGVADYVQGYLLNKATAA